MANQKMQIKLNKQFVMISVLLIVINFVFEAYYAFFMSDNFNYLGFKDDFSLIKYLEIKLLLSFFLVQSYFVFKKSHFVYAIYILLLLFFYLPNSIMFAFMNAIRGPVYSIALMLCLVALISPVRVKIKTIATQGYFKYLFITGIALIMLIPIVLTFKFQFNLNTLLLQDIYETRAVFTEMISPLTNYLYNWEVKMVIPVLLAFLLIKRKYVFALVAFLVLIYLFVISGNKAVYATSVVTLFLYFVGGKDYLKKVKYLLFYLLIALIMIPVIDVFVLNGFLLRGTFVMRVFFFPALLNYCYFDFFADVKLFFSENHFFNQFFTSPYDLNSAYLISLEYFNTDEMYANNGLISDGFKNLGYWGVLLLSTLFSFIIMFFNSVKQDARYFGIFFVLIFLFLSAPMFTIIATGGVWILFLFALTVMKNKS